MQTNLVDFSADDGLVDLVLDARDRLMVDGRTNHLVDGGVMMAILDPEMHQQTFTKCWLIQEFT